MSILNKQWKVLNHDNTKSILLKICENRGLDTSSKIYEFCRGDYSIKNPYLFSGMKKAVDRIRKAVKKKERIIVFGDYDVDGITATALLFNALKKIGAHVSYRIPHRVREGYSLNKNYIDEFKSLDVKLVITVDCGISSHKEIAYASKKRIDVIVTDHHLPKKGIPSYAFAVINPKTERKLKECYFLSGAGVAYKLVCALIDDKKYLNDQLDLVVLGIIADCVPLKKENRILAKKGLQVLSKTNKIGLKKLIAQAGITSSLIAPYQISFYLAPRLNACGRLEHAYHSMDVLLGKTKKLEFIEHLNTKRQSLTQDFLKQAELSITTAQKSWPIFILKNPGWHEGVLGLIAGKLSEKYNRPAIVMKERKEDFVASARSVEGIDIMEIIESASYLLPHFGGHKQACGFTILKENFEEFEYKILKKTKTLLGGKKIKNILKIDCEINPSDINWKTVKDIEKLEPFGTGNPQPLMMMSDLSLKKIRVVGKTKNHISFIFEKEKKDLNVIGFYFSEFKDKIEKGNMYDIVFALEKNEWNGKEEIKLRLKDIRVK